MTGRLTYSVITLLSLILVVTDPDMLSAQSSLTFNAGLSGTISSESYQPFWLTANRQGIYEDGSANGVGYLTLIRKSATPMEGVERADQMETADSKVTWGGKLTLLGRGSSHSTLYFHEAYLNVSSGVFRLSAGRQAVKIGHGLSSLSTGSAGFSQNAAPIPRITLSVDNFTPIPLTGGWIEFKGHFSHGWLPDDRLALDIPANSPVGLSGSYLHDKSLYFRNGGTTGFKFYFGMIHGVEWSGRTATGREIPDSFNDFMNVMLARGGGDDTPGGERVNALGAHTGVWDLGVTFDLSNSGVHIYHQHLFTDGTGLRFKNYMDGLYGLEISNPISNNVVETVLWEYLYTKNQSGPGLPDPMVGDSPDFCGGEANCGFEYYGRDDYYNNYFYLSGFSNRSRAIGNPLLLTRDRIALATEDLNTYSDRYFASTRLISHHFGLAGRFQEGLSYKFLATWNRHYGTYWGSNLGQPWGSLDPSLDQQEYFFNPPQHQWYFLMEMQWELPFDERISIQTSLGIDQGDIFNTIGFLGGVHISLTE